MFHQVTELEPWIEFFDINNLKFFKAIVPKLLSPYKYRNLLSCGIISVIANVLVSTIAKKRKHIQSSVVSKPVLGRRYLRLQ